MASTTANISPQSNLKDRIAALQRLNHQNNTTVNNLAAANVLAGSQPSPSRATLRDKIAKFEKRGGTPIPRGTFGLGAPPLDDGASRKKGELYGNRVPGLNRPSGPLSTFMKPLSPPPSFSAASSLRKRSLSVSGLDAVTKERDPSITSDLVSPDNATTVLGNSSDEAAKGGGSSLLDDFPASENRPSTYASRRSTVVFGRRSVSDAFIASDMPKQMSTEVESLEPKVADCPSSDVGDAVSGEHTSAGPEPNKESLEQVTTQEETVADAEEPQPVDSVTPTATTSPAPSGVSPVFSSEDSPSTPTPTIQEQVNSSSTVNKPSRRTSATFSKIPVRPTPQIRVRHDDGNVAFRDSVTSAVQPAVDSVLSPKNVATGSSSSSGVIPDVVITDIPSPVSQDSRPEANPSAQQSPTDSKPTGDFQSKLRKKLYPNSGQTFQEPSLTPKPGRKSFTAVVHKKIDDVVSAKPLDAPDVGSVVPATPARVKTLAGKGSLPTSSPGSGELALLVAEAALLERQLGAGVSSAGPTESNNSVPSAIRSKPTSQSLSPHEMGNNVSSDNADPTRSTHSVPYAVPTLREVGEDDETDFTSSSPDTNSRPRKLSHRIKSLATASSNTLRSLTSSTYSRPSISSELSWEDPMRGSSPLPSTPREDNSIGGSSGSSFKWSSPKRNPLSRATSFADKIMNRAGKTKSLVEDSGDNNHLSPSRANAFSRSKDSTEKSRSLSSHPPSPRLRLPDFLGPSSTSSPPSLKASPPSKASSSTNNRLFDGDLFDPFPAVPEDTPTLSPSNHATTSNLSNTTTRSSSQTIRNS